MADARRDLDRRRAQRSEDDLRRALPPEGSRDFLAALRSPGLSLIAEHKRRSPSAGTIREDRSLEEVVRSYERAGAAAVSVLTDAANFGGSLGDLAAARAATELPILRKDFIVDSYQVLEAAAAGADAILLIVAALPPDELRRLHAQAREVGIETLVEVHDAPELDVALSLDSPVIGINNRNLATLEVDIGTTFELLTQMDAAAAVVAESGLHARVQLDQLEAAGVDAVLIGEALMRAEDIEAAVRGLTAPTM